jgi:hypothetical protein
MLIPKRVGALLRAELRYLVSANGRNFQHPDSVAIAFHYYPMRVA